MRAVGTALSATNHFSPLAPTKGIVKISQTGDVKPFLCELKQRHVSDMVDLWHAVPPKAARRKDKIETIDREAKVTLLCFLKSKRMVTALVIIIAQEPISSKRFRHLPDRIQRERARVTPQVHVSRICDQSRLFHLD